MTAYTKLKENRHDLKTVIPLSMPYTLLIEPSNYCNFRCVSCFQSLKSENYLTRHRMIMPMDRYLRVMDQLQEWNGERLKVLKLSLYGEPFTNPNFCEMLRVAKELNVADRVETTTNASLITPEIARQLVEYEIDYIRVSIYGATQERYRHITGVNHANIDEIYHNLECIQNYKRRFNHEKPFVSVKMLNTFGEENDLFTQRFSPVADETYIDMPHNWIASDEKSFIGSLYDTPEKQVALSQNNIEDRRERKSCPMPFTTLAVRADGMVSPCCVDYAGYTNLANVDEISLRNIWKGTALYNFQAMQLMNRNYENKSCAKCEFYRSDYYMRDDIDGFPVEKLLESSVKTEDE